MFAFQKCCQLKCTSLTRGISGTLPAVGGYSFWAKPDCLELAMFLNGSRCAHLGHLTVDTVRKQTQKSKLFPRRQKEKCGVRGKHATPACLLRPPWTISHNTTFWFSTKIRWYFRANALQVRLQDKAADELKTWILGQDFGLQWTVSISLIWKVTWLVGSYSHFSSRSSNLVIKLISGPTGSVNHLDFLHSYKCCWEKTNLSFQSSLSICFSCNSRENVSMRIKARLWCIRGTLATIEKTFWPISVVINVIVFVARKCTIDGWEVGTH